jgi:hypothetical protein
MRYWYSGASAGAGSRADPGRPRAPSPGSPRGAGAGPGAHQLLVGQLLDLVGGVAPLHVGPQRPSLDRLREDHGRGADAWAARSRRRRSCGVEPAPAERPDLVVGHVLDEGEGAGVLAEEVLAHVGAALGPVSLVLAVDGGCMTSTSAPSVSAASSGSQPEPQITLITFHPAPRKIASSSWMIFPLPRTGSVEALEVAVHHPDEVAETFTGGKGDRAQGLRLVHLAVADEAPHPRLRGVVDAAVVQVPVEAGVVDRVDRPEAHRHRRVLPELGHQPGMGIRREPAATDLEPEAVEVGLVEPPLEEGPSVDAGSGVTLDVHGVAGCARVLAR